MRDILTVLASSEIKLEDDSRFFNLLIDNDYTEITYKLEEDEEAVLPEIASVLIDSGFKVICEPLGEDKFQLIIKH